MLVMLQTIAPLKFNVLNWNNSRLHFWNESHLDKQRQNKVDFRLVAQFIQEPKRKKNVILKMKLKVLKIMQDRNNISSLFLKNENVKIMTSFLLFLIWFCLKLKSKLRFTTVEQKFLASAFYNEDSKENVSNFYSNGGAIIFLQHKRWLTHYIFSCAICLL